MPTYTRFSVPTLRGWSNALSGLGYRRDLLLMLSDGRCVRRRRRRRPISHSPGPIGSGGASGASGAFIRGARRSPTIYFALTWGGTTAKACLNPESSARANHSFRSGTRNALRRGAAGYRFRSPAIDMIERSARAVAASHVLIRRGLLQVGPDSAGASPGPVCYGLGNEFPTVTDCELGIGLPQCGLISGRQDAPRSASGAKCDRKTHCRAAGYRCCRSSLGRTRNRNREHARKRQPFTQ